MNTPSTTSPFLTAAEETPWLVWKKNAPIIELHNREQTDCRFVGADKQYEESLFHPHFATYRPPSIQRAQYNAVLNRISRASRMTGQYSTWST